MKWFILSALLLVSCDQSTTPNKNIPNQDGGVDSGTNQDDDDDWIWFIIFSASG